MASGIESACTVRTAATVHAAAARGSRIFFPRATRRPAAPWTRPAACAPSPTRSSTCQSCHGASYGGRARSQPRCRSSRAEAANVRLRRWKGACAPCRPERNLSALPARPRWTCRAAFPRRVGGMSRSLCISLIVHQPPQRPKATLCRIFARREEKFWTPRGLTRKSGQLGCGFIRFETPCCAARDASRRGVNGAPPAALATTTNTSFSTVSVTTLNLT